MFLNFLVNFERRIKIGRNRGINIIITIMPTLVGCKKVNLNMFCKVCNENCRAFTVLAVTKNEINNVKRQVLVNYV